MVHRLFGYTITQQTQNICVTFVQRRPNFVNVGPTLYKCYTNVLGTSLIGGQVAYRIYMTVTVDRTYLDCFYIYFFMGRYIHINMPAV